MRERAQSAPLQACFIDCYSHPMKKHLAVCLILAAFALPAVATPGKVNAAGCHASKKDGAHCHPERARDSGGSDGTQAARNQRLKRECKGAVNAGACSGYTR
jgi:hypothetical protein